MPSFLLDNEDEGEADRHSAIAWERARAIVASMPPSNWPELPPGIPAELQVVVRQALNEAYFYGLLFAAARLQVIANRNGVTVDIPPLLGTDGFMQARRHISYETLLPFVDRDVSKSEAQALAWRFLGITRICADFAKMPPLPEPEIY